MKEVLFCCLRRILLENVTFTRIYMMNINSTTWMMFIILYFKSTTFGVTMSWPGRVSRFCLWSVGQPVGSGRVIENVPLHISKFASFRCCRKQHCDTSPSQWYFHPQSASLKLQCAAIIWQHGIWFVAWPVDNSSIHVLPIIYQYWFVLICACTVYTAPLCSCYMVFSWLYPSVEPC